MGPRLPKAPGGHGVAYCPSPEPSAEFMVERGFLAGQVLGLVDGGDFSIEAALFGCRGYGWKLYEWLRDKWEGWVARWDVKLESEDEETQSRTKSLG